MTSRSYSFSVEFWNIEYSQSDNMITNYIHMDLNLFHPYYFQDVGLCLTNSHSSNNVINNQPWHFTTWISHDDMFAMYGGSI